MMIGNNFGRISPNHLVVRTTEQTRNSCVTKLFCCLFFRLSIWLSIWLSLSLVVLLVVSFFGCPFGCPFGFSFFGCPFGCLFLWLSIRLSLSLVVHLVVHLVVSFFGCPFGCLFLWLSIWLSLSLVVHLVVYLLSCNFFDICKPINLGRKFNLTLRLILVFFMAQSLFFDIPSSSYYYMFTCRVCVEKIYNYHAVMMMADLCPKRSLCTCALCSSSTLFHHANTDCVYRSCIDRLL